MICISHSDEIVAIVRIIPHERIQNRSVEQIMDVPVPQVQEENLEVAKIDPQERILESNTTYQGLQASCS